MIREMWMKQRIKEVLCFRVFKISGEREREREESFCLLRKLSRGRGDRAGDCFLTISIFQMASSQSKPENVCGLA